MKKASFLTIIILALFSCKKDLSFKGRVYNSASNRGIEGVPFKITTSKGDTKGGGSAYSFTSSTDGFFSKNLKLRKGQQIDVTAIIDTSKYIPLFPKTQQFDKESLSKKLELGMIEKVGAFLVIKKQVQSSSNNGLTVDIKLKSNLCDFEYVFYMNSDNYYSTILFLKPNEFKIPEGKVTLSGFYQAEGKDKVIVSQTKTISANSSQAPVFEITIP